MEAIRQRRIKRDGKKVVIELPDDFTAQEVDVILWASAEETSKVEEKPLDEWRKHMDDFYSNYNVDLTDFKFNRDELYDRP